MANKRETVDSLSPLDLSCLTKDQMKAYFINTQELFNTLYFTLVSEDSCKIVPDLLRRPVIWYLGHTTALYINKLKLYHLINNTGKEPQDIAINVWFETFFATGVDPIYKEELDNDVYREKMPDSKLIWEFRL